MIFSSTLTQFTDKRIMVREFGKGARDAAKDTGITVIIDVFRASTTILTLLEAGCEVYPFLNAEEALNSDADYKIGETGSDLDDRFDFDNSPVEVMANWDTLKHKKVAIRTTNGTRGLISALGSEEIIIGAFRNLTTVVKYCFKKYREGYTINFVAMGSKKISRPEDVYCAKMMFYRLIYYIGDHKFLLDKSEDNPWNRDWIGEITKKRFKVERKMKDYRYALHLDMNNYIPYYNPETGIIEIKR